MSHHQHAGFTLIEILVALVILSLALNAFHTTFSTTVNVLLHLQDKTAAEWVARNIIAEVQLRLIDINTDRGSTSGTDMMFDRPWQWHVALNKTDRAMSLITVDVKKPGNTEASIHLTGYLSTN